MASGYRKIFWGFFIATFHLNLGSLMIFPPFIGYVMIMIGISMLHQKYDANEFQYAKMLFFLKHSSPSLISLLTLI